MYQKVPGLGVYGPALPSSSPYPDRIHYFGGLSGLGFTEAQYIAAIGKQFEITFKGVDGNTHKAAGIFTGLINSTKRPGVKIAVLMPSCDTTNPNQFVPIGPNDRTAVYVDNISNVSFTNYNTSTWPKWGVHGGSGGTNQQGGAGGGILPEPLPPVTILDKMMAMLKNPWVVASSVATIGLFTWLMLRKKKGGVSPAPVKA